MKTDIEIARSVQMRRITEIAESIGIPEEKIDQYGRYMAKVSRQLVDEEKVAKSKLILVTAITATKAGIGKTTVSVGLALGLNKIGKKAIVALREPSLGPCFGMKGGAAGGGYAQVLPMEKINLHFTGDFHAITSAHNMISALMDNYIYQHQADGFALKEVIWKRVLDVNDRSLRNIVTGLGPRTNGLTAESGFDITPASELMAILCLSKNLDDMRRRIDNILLGYTFDDKPFMVKDLGITGSILVLLKTAFKPNLVQTLEGTPAFVHGGPFANIAHGCNSVIATRLALKLADYVVTNELSKTDYIYAYKDSLYIAPTDMDHDYRSDCYIGINGLFRKETSGLGGKADYSDTLQIARGTKNPLRFLEYNIEPQAITDTSLIPKPEMKLLMDAGVSKINFVLGKAKVDENDAESVQNIQSIKQKIQAIVNNEFATLKSIEIVGYASPEGSYKQNLSLAKARTDLILKELAASLDPSVAKFVELTSESVVEPWSKVANMLRETDPELAAYIDDLVYKYADTHDKIIPHMRNHKKYRTFLLQEILPSLRKVEYTLNYSEFRKLKDHEIWDRYNAKTEEISRYEYWRLIDTAPDSLTRYSLISEGLEKYPNFTYVANDMAIQLIKQDSINLEILKPSMGKGKKVPDEVIYNQALMALGAREVAMADSLARLLPTNDQSAHLKSITAALAGDFEGAYQIITKSSSLPAVPTLLPTAPYSPCTTLSTR